MTELIRKYIIRTIFFLATVLLTSQLNAQDFDFKDSDQSDTVRLDTSVIFESFNIRMSLRDQLLPLDSIIGIALQRNPQVKFQQSLVDKSKYNLAHIRRLWSNNVYGFGTYTWGDQTILLNNNTTDAAQNTNISAGYQIGIGMRLPLYELYARQSRIKQAKAELDGSKYQKSVYEQNIVRQIISEYYKLVTAQQVMMIVSESYEAQSLNAKIAEKEMLKGQMKMTSFSTIHKSATDVREKLELKKQDFYIAFYTFEALVGVKMIDLKRKR